MKKYKICFQRFYQNKYLMAISLGGLLLNLTAWVVFWLGLDFDKTALILHYNSFFGIDKIAINSEERRLVDIFFVPLSGLLIMVVNYSLGVFLIFSNWKNFSEDDSQKIDFKKISTAVLGGYFIFLAGMIFQIVVLIYSVAIVLVNR
ncbi:MAG: hypothetical protein KAQ63_01675 [Candidatus Moranbacteria bacterium]|nr:hypothetical protein [Candidatus Moranbacteria bacterium]